jgi:hypothetical protein
MKIQRFDRFISEDLASEYTAKLGGENKDIKEEILKMIQKSVNSDDRDVFTEFIDAFVENPNDSKIEGLINGSDIHYFYKKFSGEIDEILSNNRFYEEKPSDMDCFSLYDYTIKGTMKSVESLLQDIKKDISSEQSTQEPNQVPE